MSLIVIPAAAIVSKACLRISGVKVHGLETLQGVLNDKETRGKGKGILTR